MIDLLDRIWTWFAERGMCPCSSPLGHVSTLGHKVCSYFMGRGAPDRAGHEVVFFPGPEHQ